MADQPRNIAGKSVPGHLWRVAEAIQPLIGSPTALARWREKIVEWAQVGASGSVQRSAGEYFPLPLDLPLLDKFAVLGAVYDVVLGNEAGVARIEPHESRDRWDRGIQSNSDEPWLRFTVVKVHCLRGSTARDEGRLYVFLEDVKADLDLSVPAAVSPPQVPSPRTAARKTPNKRGATKPKLIAALTEHHQYSNGGCLNRVPVGCKELAGKAGVSTGAASNFFETQFGGHDKYGFICANSSTLIAALRLLNNEVSPKQLLSSDVNQIQATDEDADE